MAFAFFPESAPPLLGRPGAFTLDDPRLAVDLAGVRLPTPVILSAMYYDRAILGKAMGLGFGAVTTKTITITPRPGHPEPTLVRVATPEGPGFVNCNGFKTPGSPRSALATLLLRGPVPAGIALTPAGHLLVADRQAAVLFALTAEGRRVDPGHVHRGRRSPRPDGGARHAGHAPGRHRGGSLPGPDQPGRLAGQRRGSASRGRWTS